MAALGRQELCAPAASGRQRDQQHALADQAHAAAGARPAQMAALAGDSGKRADIEPLRAAL